MSKTTPNYKFIKPELNDPANIETTNPNWDTLDTELKSKASISDIDGKLADKADKIYVDDALKKKADTSAVDSKNNLQDESIEQTKSDLSSHINNSLNPHKVTAKQIGAIGTDQIGVPNGICPLNEHSKIPSNYESVSSVNNQTGDVSLALKDLPDDSEHRTVTDTEKNIWNGLIPNYPYQGNALNVDLNNADSDTNKPCYIDYNSSACPPGIGRGIRHVYLIEKNWVVVVVHGSTFDEGTGKTWLRFYRGTEWYPLDGWVELPDKKYVDSKLSLSGGTMSGSINMNNNMITGIPDQLAVGSAVNVHNLRRNTTAIENGTINDSLGIDLSDPHGDANTPHFVIRGETINIPDDLATGVRYTSFINNSFVIVTIVGLDLNNKSAVWENVFNHDWTGWIKIGGTDAVIEEGSIDVWQYRKWQSGKAECWCNVTITKNFTDNMGNGIFRGAGLNTTKYPFNFVAFAPIEIVTVTSDGSKTVWSASEIKNTTETTGRYYAFSIGASSSPIPVTFNIHVEGRWK